MKKNLLINLPEDVFISNILLSKVLPIKSLVSLKCVCKCLRKLISSPAFIKLQLHTNQVVYNNNQLALLSPTYPNGTVFCFLKVDDSDPCHFEVVSTFFRSIQGRRPLKIWGSCNGLLCLVEEDDVCLWNPFTKEYIIVPPPLPLISTQVSQDSGSITYGFGYDSLMDVYKIIRCQTEYKVERRRFEDDDVDKHVPIITDFQIYTLETNTWRKISSDNNPYKSYYVVSLRSVVLVNGALHWMISTSNWLMEKSSSEMTETKILSFDIEKEVLQEIQIPFISYKVGELPYPESESGHPEIQVLKECLCILELDSSNKNYCNVWMMKDYGVEGTWTKLFKIESINKNFTTQYRLLRFCNNGTKILMGLTNSLFVYDPISDKVKRIDNGNLGYPGIIYIESLVSLNSGVYKGLPVKWERKRKRNQAN